jgi:tetratricopeptide (TPR) repeat protein
VNDRPSPSTSSPSAPAWQQLVESAGAALEAGDHDAYEAAAAETAAIDDPHRRYVARRDLALRALSFATEREGRDKELATKALVAAARSALTALESTPAEPMLLHLAGSALYRLGALGAAERVMKAASSLDPEVPGLRGNLREVRRLREAGVRPAPPAGAARHLRDLERRARQAAQRARPSLKGTIALCMIVKDEEAVLGRALESVRGAVDEIVIVDTGSQDRTIEIAREHGARVIERPWDDDFAAARNAGIDVATTEWILVLDADEALDPADAPRLRRVARQDWREAFLLTVVNRFGEEGADSTLSADSIRMFRNRPQHRYAGRVHENVMHCLPIDAPERTGSAGVRVHHDGYLAETVTEKDKRQRNLALLERQLAEGGDDGFLHFNLGSELLPLGETERAVDHFARAWDKVLASGHATKLQYAASLAVRYATALREAGRHDEAEEITDRGLELFPDHTDLVFNRAMAARNRGDLEAAEAGLRRALEMGDAPPLLAALEGAGSYLAASALAEMLAARGDLAGAAAVLAEHERAELPHTAVAAVVNALDERLAETDIDGFVAILPLTERIKGFGDRERREILACLYLQHGFLDSAADEWAAACQEHGPDVAALTGLARVAAARGDHEDARIFEEGARELAGAAAS